MLKQDLDPLLDHFFKTGNSDDIIEAIEHIIAQPLHNSERDDIEYILMELMFQNVDLPLHFYSFMPRGLNRQFDETRPVYERILDTPLQDVPSSLLTFHYFDFYFYHGMFRDPAPHHAWIQKLFSSLSNIHIVLKYTLQQSYKIKNIRCKDYQTEVYNPYLDIADILSFKETAFDIASHKLSDEQFSLFGQVILKLCHTIVRQDGYFYSNQKALPLSSLSDLFVLIKEYWGRYPDDVFFQKIWDAQTPLANAICHELLLSHQEYQVFIELTDDRTSENVDFYGLYYAHKHTRTEEIELVL